MIALLAAAALATGPLNPCESYQPIGGTAGHTNGLTAMRTNAATYGAGTFARNRLQGANFMAMDFHYVAGAAQVPSWCADTEGVIAQEVYKQAMDLSATNFGFALPLLEDGPLNSRFRVFYASSVNSSTLGQRGGNIVTPLLNLYPAAAAPVVGNSRSARGLDTYTVEWIGGAYFGSDVVSIQAGYTGQRGLYLDVTQEKIALFFNSIFQGDFDLRSNPYLITGVQRFDPLKVGLDDMRKIGMFSGFYRELPWAGTETIETASLPTGRIVPDGALKKLQTGHIRQEDIYEAFDLRTAWMFGEGGGVRELQVGYHTKGWYQRVEDDFDAGDGAFNVQAGMINLPDQPLLGVRGGPRPTLRADAVYYGGDNGEVQVRATARMNDPELLDIYPFAYNALGVNFEMTFVGSRL